MLGRPKVLVDDQTLSLANRKALALVAYLLLKKGQQSRDKLATLLWPEYNQTRARANLRRVIWILNQSPLSNYLEVDKDGLSFGSQPGLWVDVVSLSKAISYWNSQVRGEKSESDFTQLSEALALYRGDLLADFYLSDSNEFEEWAAVERERLRREVLEALDSWMNHALEQRQYDTAQKAAWKQIDLDNLRESAYRGLMQALHHSGQRIAALAQYEILSELLDDELGVEPSAETKALYEKIRADVELAPEPKDHETKQEPAASGESPVMPVFILTDIESSTPLWDEYREAMLNALHQHNAILETQIEEHGGRILELRGDGVIAVFEDGQPLAAVLAIQTAFGRADWGEIGELRIRIGLHGVQVDYEGYDYFRQGDEYFGPVLNHTARIMDAGWGGQILTSNNIRQAYELPEDASWQDFGLNDLKGCEEPLHIFGLLHPDLPHQDFPPLRTLRAEEIKSQGSNGETQLPAVLESPYRGLFAFREEDSPFFYGREAFTERLLEVVHQQPMVAVVGSSGSGKSSVVHAGLLAQLRAQGNWHITGFRPGSRPFHALAATLIPELEPELSKTDQLVEINKLAQALMDGEVTLMDVVKEILANQPSGTRMPLVGDQFEELYTLVPEASLRNRFMDTLTDAVFDQQYRQAPVFSLILTLRADFLGQALSHRPFADAIQESDVKLGPMTAGELSRAIVNPAKSLQVNFESGLVSRILEDVGEEPGNLPLLEFALAMLWDKQENRLLTHQAYEDIERVDGSLARHADAVLDELSPYEQDLARRIFIQVVRPGTGTEDTRRVARRSELGDDGWSLVQRLADARLLVTGRDSEGNETVEVVHEALIRGWERLRGWMEVDREFRLWQERLRAAIRQWTASDRDEGALLRGLPLATAERWYAERPEDLSPDEIEFIKAATKQRDLREQEKQEQEAKERHLERRAKHRLQLIVGVLVIASVIGIGLTIAIFNQSQIARQERDNAQQQQALAEEQQILAERRAAEVQSLALIDAAKELMENNDPELALALAMQANQIEEPPREVLEALREIAFVPGVSRVVQAHEGVIDDLHLSPDGRFIITAGSEELDKSDEDQRESSLALWNIDNGELVQRYSGLQAPITHVEFSPDGKYLISSSMDGSFTVWDVETGQEINRLEGNFPVATDVRYLNYFPEGAERPAALFVTAKPADDSLNEIFDPLFTGDSEVVLMDPISGEILQTYEPDLSGKFRKNGGLSEDRRLMVTTHNERQDIDNSAPYNGKDTVIVWDVATGEMLHQMEVDAPGFITNAIRISPDHNQVAISMDSFGEGLLILWDLQSDEVIRREFDDFAFLFQYSPDGNSIFATVDGTGIEQLERETGDTIRNFNDRGDYLIFSDDGSRMLSFGPMILWDLGNGEALAKFHNNDPAYHGIIMPDGRSAVTGHPSGLMRFWDFKSGAAGQSASERLVFEEHGSAVFDAMLSPDGQRILSAGGDLDQGLDANSDNSLILWDTSTGEIEQRIEGHQTPIWSAALSPDGQMAASGSQDGTIKLWDLSSGEMKFEWTGFNHLAMDLSFTHDGKSLLAAIGAPFGNLAIPGQIVLLDIETGEELRDFELADGQDMPQVFSADISPDGRQVLTGFSHSGIVLWDLQTGEELRRYQEIDRDEPVVVEGLAFSADGKQFISSDFEASVILWDVESGEEVRRFSLGEPATAHQVDFSPDGQSLIVAYGPASAEDTLKAVVLWDLSTGAEKQRFEGHGDWVRATGFGPDGRWIFSTSGDSTVRLWEVAGGEIDLFEWIENNRYVRELTDEEKQRYHVTAEEG